MASFTILELESTFTRFEADEAYQLTIAIFSLFRSLKLPRLYLLEQ